MTQEELVELYQSYCQCGHALYHHVHPIIQIKQINLGRCTHAEVLVYQNKEVECQCLKYVAADPLTISELIENHHEDSETTSS